MRKLLTAGLAALTLGGAIAATAVPATADARPFHGGYHGGHGYRGGYYHRGGYGGAALAGLAGLAVGAAIADQPYYGYYDYPAYGYGYGVCQTRHWAWDPYLGRHVLVTRPYPC